jgi:hypothetical protein
MSKKNIILIVVVSILLLGTGGFWLVKIKNKPEEKKPANQEKNYFEINDELAGIYFKVGKKFDRMPANQLQTKNPNFIYGFSAKDDNSVTCFISQTKRENAGVVKVADLRDGVLEQMKKSNPDAKLDDAQIVDVGENNNKGAKLKMSYTEADKIPMIQWETVGITEKLSTFAFCNCPKAVVDLYQEEFELFLSSLKIK